MSSAQGILDELYEEQYESQADVPAGLYRMSAKPTSPWGAQTTVTLDRWTPTHRQRAMLYSPVRELFFGGARGPGKTDALLADFAGHANEHGARAIGILFRRTLDEFAEVQVKAQSLFHGIARWSEKDGTWHFDNGARLRLRYLDAYRHVGRYQGHQYTWIGFDELTEWADPAPYLYMFGCLRNTGDIVGVMRASGNPGRPGHLWVFDRFVSHRDPENPMKAYRDPATKIERLFIDAQLEDNPYLWKNEPDYEMILRQMSVDENTYQAQRYGRWDLVVGQALHEWDPNMHTMRPIRLDPRWPRWASLDWGTKRPYALLYWTRTPDGHVYQFRERYGIKVDDYGQYVSNVGTGEDAFTVAKEEWEFARNNGIQDIVCDPDVQTNIGVGDTVDRIFRKVGWAVHIADNNRKRGKQAVHSWLGTILRDGYPMLRVFDTCIHTLRTIPTIVYNSRTGDEEDVEKEGETHIYDSWRYSATSMFADHSEMAAMRGTIGDYGGVSIDQRRMQQFDVSDPSLIWGHDMMWRNAGAFRR